MDKILLLIQLGWRNILRHRKRSLIVITTATVGMIGVFLGIGSMNGFRLTAIGTAIESGLGHVQIRPLGYFKKRKIGMVLEDGERIGHILKNLHFPVKTFFAPRFAREGLLRLENFSQGLLILGIDSELEKNVSAFDNWLIQGNFFQEQDEKDRLYGIIPCVLGAANAKKLAVEIGDTVILSIGDVQGNSSSIKARINGIFQSPSEPIDKYTVLVKRRDLSRMFEHKDANIFGYFVLLSESTQRADMLKEYLNKHFHKEKLDVLTYKELEPAINKLFDLFDTFMGVFYVIIMFGFSLVLVNALLQAVFERMHEIGIVRALGTRPGFIFWMVIFESVIITMLGSILGLVIGGGMVFFQSKNGLDLSIFSQGMELFAKSGSVIYPSLSFQDIAMGFIMAQIMGFVGSVYPAWKAVRMSPIQAIYNK